jgi:acetyl esterase
VAQAALAISDPEYAAAAGIEVRTDPAQIQGMVLVSGPYDMAFDIEKSPAAWYLRTVMWAYSGTRAFRTDPRIAFLSLVNHCSGACPPAFITTGPADPLLPQSVRFAERLTTAGVPVETLFFDPETTDPAIGHEYQLLLETPEGREAMRQIVAFARRRTGASYRSGVSDDWEAPVVNR